MFLPLTSIEIEKFDDTTALVLSAGLLFFSVFFSVTRTKFEIFVLIFTNNKKEA